MDGFVYIKIRNAAARIVRRQVAEYSGSVDSQPWKMARLVSRRCGWVHLRIKENLRDAHVAQR